MIEFKIDSCPRCGKRHTLMINNNPIGGSPICFDCIKETLNYQNLQHADLFCRTYNLPFNPDLWIELSKTEEDNVFQEYTRIVLEDDENKPNLYYAASTRDLWARVNKEWEKSRSFTEILMKMEPIKESYQDRGHLKWGEQYTFNELVKLDSLYTRTLKANNITDPMQKEAIKMLCKLQVEMDEAIRMKDAKAIKDFSSAYSTYAKQANLDGMIAESRTDDITTVAELYDYMEKMGFKFKYYDGTDKDEADRAIRDIQDTNRRLILESTGLQNLVEEMARKRMETKEEEVTNEIVNGDVSIEDMLNFTPEDSDIETESDEEVLDMDFDTPNDKLKINRLNDAEE